MLKYHEDLPIPMKILRKQYKMLRKHNHHHKGSPHDDKRLKCNGLTHQYYIEKEALENRIKEFCDSRKSFEGHKKTSIGERYNEGKANDVVLSMDFAQHTTISKSECHRYMMMFAGHEYHTCDPHYPILNRHNWKHGGKVHIPHKDVTFGVEPKSGNNPACEPFPYYHLVNRERKEKPWADRDSMKRMISSFCERFNRNPHREAGTHEARGYVYGSGSYKVHIAALWTDDFSISSKYCEEQLLHIAVDGCHGNEPIYNPTNKKYGSRVIVQGKLLLSIQPYSVPDEYPPKEIDQHGHFIEPKCDKPKHGDPPKDKVTELIKEYCTAETQVGDKKIVHWTFGPDALCLKASSTWASPNAYRQGASVCRDVPRDAFKHSCEYAFERININCECSSDALPEVLHQKLITKKPS
jgi:hypothetical protein